MEPEPLAMLLETPEVRNKIQEVQQIWTIMNLSRHDACFQIKVHYCKVHQLHIKFGKYAAFYNTSIILSCA